MAVQRHTSVLFFVPEFSNSVAVRISPGAHCCVNAGLCDACCGSGRSAAVKGVLINYIIMLVAICGMFSDR
jgi:hypothetical protein